MLRVVGRKNMDKARTFVTRIEYTVVHLEYLVRQHKSLFDCLRYCDTVPGFKAAAVQAGMPWDIMATQTYIFFNRRLCENEVEKNRRDVQTESDEARKVDLQYRVKIATGYFDQPDPPDAEG